MVAAAVCGLRRRRCREARACARACGADKLSLFYFHQLYLDCDLALLCSLTLCARREVRGVGCEAALAKKYREKKPLRMGGAKAENRGRKGPRVQ